MKGWRLCLSRPCRQPTDHKEGSLWCREAYAESAAGATWRSPGKRSWLLSIPGRGLRALFFSAPGACEWVEQASTTGGSAHGQHGQRSRAYRSLGTADGAIEASDASTRSPYPHRRTAAALVA